jgi:hypothetical protein
MIRASWVALPLLICSVAVADEAATCPNGIAPIGSSRAQAAPTIDPDAPPLEALKAWRDALVARYRACDLAPFEPEKVDLVEKGSAFSHELGRGVGGYRVRPEGAVTAETSRGLEILSVELAGNQGGVREALLPLRFLSAWPLKNDGEVVSGCRLELAVTKRAELCLDDIDDVERKAASAVSTQARVILLCPPPLSVDDVAATYLTPIAPPALPSVKVERAPAQVAAFLPTFTTAETATRELSCNDGRSWCAGLTAGGNLAITHGPEQKLTPVSEADLDGFTLASPGRWTGVEHTPSGLRIARSAIGSYYGLPIGGHTRFWLGNDTCMVWKRKSTGPRRYPYRVDLGSLCMIDGIWTEGMQTVAPLRGEPRNIVQTRYADDVATRCVYTQ